AGQAAQRGSDPQSARVIRVEVINPALREALLGGEDREAAIPEASQGTGLKSDPEIPRAVFAERIRDRRIRRQAIGLPVVVKCFRSSLPARDPASWFRESRNPDIPARVLVQADDVVRSQSVLRRVNRFRRRGGEPADAIYFRIAY